MTSAQNRFSITSLNVWRGTVRNELIEFVRSKMSSTSVFCFQETDGGIGEVFDEILLDDFVVHHAVKPAEPDDYSVSTYVRRELKVLNATTVCYGADEAGLVLRCKIADSAGLPIVVSNVHGKSQPGNKLDTPGRLKLSRQLIEAEQDTIGTQVIMGDFNLLPEAESIQMFAANGFKNLIDEFEIPTTRNELAWQKFPPHMKQLYADYTFVRGEDIDCDFSVEDIAVSDHLPMTLQILNKTPLPLHSSGSNYGVY